MSIIISPVITDVGLGVFTPSATGIEFTFTHVSVGTGTSIATSAVTALENEIARFPIAGGGIVTGGKAVSINVLITNHLNANPQNYVITEIGFHGLNATGDTILFAIHRQSTAIIAKVSGADIACPFVFGLAALPAENMTVMIDADASAMLALLGQHVAANHPHTQYKRTLDNTEALKIADGVEDDDAVSKGQLDAEATTRAGVDSALAGQIAQEIQNRVDEDERIESDRVNQDLALSIALAAEITNRQNGDLAILNQINNVVFCGSNHIIISNTGNTFAIPANKTIRVILIGGGGGSGTGGSGGGGYGGAGQNAGDSLIYPTGNSSAFFIKAKGGLGGGAAYGGNGSSYAIGNSPDGQEVDINNLYDVVVLSYQDGQKGNYSVDSPIIRHPVVKKLGLTTSGQGKAGTSDGYYAIGGGGSGGAFVECLIINRNNTPLNLTVDCGAGGTGGVGLNLDGTVINGQNGNNGICVVFYE